MAIEARPGPWAAAHAVRRGYAVLRVIDLQAGTDSFQTVRGRRGDTADRYAAGECVDQLLDGATLILPAAERSPAEVAAIIQAHDAAARGRQTIAAPQGATAPDLSPSISAGDVGRAPAAAAFSGSRR